MVERRNSLVVFTQNRIVANPQVLATDVVYHIDQDTHTVDLARIAFPLEWDQANRAGVDLPGPADRLQTQASHVFCLQIMLDPSTQSANSAKCSIQ